MGREGRGVMSGRITDELREYIDFLDRQDLIDPDDYYILVATANKIDAEHRRRMEQFRAIIDERCIHSAKRRPRDACASDD